MGAFTCRLFWIPAPISPAVAPSGFHLRLVTSLSGRRCSCGSLWHFRHQPIVSSWSWTTTFISFTCPWHDTHDTPLFTCTAWLKYAYSGSLWLASLRAAEEIAKKLGDGQAATRYHELFAKGQKSFIAKLWNGSYFRYDTESEYKDNIQADQLAGQWYADVTGLGDIVPREMRAKSLQAIYDNNVMKFAKGEMGAVNGITADGTIITTNDLTKIDPALGLPRKLPDGTTEFISTRPGRIDKAVELTYMEPADKKLMARKILEAYEKEYLEMLEFVERYPDLQETPAQFQERCAQVALRCFWDDQNDGHDRNGSAGGRELQKV